MDLIKENYTGDVHKKTIVSSEKGRRHVAINPSGAFEVRHYKLDGELVKNRPCCDYLLVNDSSKKAYYIELKGADLSHAADQLLAGERECREYLENFVSYFRIITSKTRTQELNSPKFRHFQQTIGVSRIKYGTNMIRETLK